MKKLTKCMHRKWPLFYDRISWASYLNMAGLLEKPKRGIYEINDSNKLLKTPEKVNQTLKELEKENQHKRKN